MSHDFSQRLLELADKAESHAALRFRAIEQVSMACTERVLTAFADHRVSDTYFRESTGYGYDDQGRDKLEEIYAQVFGCEAALVRSGFVNGSHAIACGMFACVKSGETLLSLTGNVYDTLRTVTGQHGPLGGTFADYGIRFDMVEMKDGLPDYAEIERRAADPGVKAVFIQRSRGYGQRQTLSIDECCRAVNAGPEDLTVRRTPVMHAGWNACARRANSVPMSPVPSTVMRAPCSERIPPGSVSQPPARMISVYSIWRRSSIRQTMMRCSEMVVP